MGIGLCTIIELTAASRALGLNAIFPQGLDLGDDSYGEASIAKNVRALSLGNGCYSTLFFFATVNLFLFTI